MAWRSRCGCVSRLGSYQDGDALGDEVADELPHGVVAARVQAGGGLVQEDQPWPPHQGHRDVEAALHAAGVGGRGPPRRLDEVEALQQPGGPRPPLGRRQMQQAAHEEQVLLAGEQVVDRGELPGDSDHGAHRAGLAAQVVPHDAGRASVRRDQGGQDLDAGGLARAVRPEQCEDLALADAEVDAVEDDLLPVRLAQAVRGNRGARRVLGQCVHATHARTLTQGQGQALVATFPRASCIRYPRTGLPPRQRTTRGASNAISGTGRLHAAERSRQPHSRRSMTCGCGGHDIPEREPPDHRRRAHSPALTNLSAGRCASVSPR